MTTARAEGRSFFELRQRAYQAASVGTQQGAGQAKRNVYQRSADVRDYILVRAGGCCEGCRADAPFLTTEGRPYLEPHHIRRVSDGGPDHPAHVIALCPNCHRRVHFGKDGKAYNAELAERVREIEQRNGPVALERSLASARQLPDLPAVG